MLLPEIAFNMDTREATWHKQAAELLSLNNVEVYDSDFHKVFGYLQETHKLVSQLWWNIHSFEKCI